MYGKIVLFEGLFPTFKPSSLLSVSNDGQFVRKDKDRIIIVLY